MNLASQCPFAAVPCFPPINFFFFWRAFSLARLHTHTHPPKRKAQDVPFQEGAEVLLDLDTEAIHDLVRACGGGNLVDRSLKTCTSLGHTWAQYCDFKKQNDGPWRHFCDCN